MADLNDVILALDAERDEVVAALNNVVDELKTANRELGGWYDSTEPRQHHEGIGLRVYGIELKMDQACEHLADIRNSIGRALKDQLAICDDILDQVRAIRNEVKSGYDQADSLRAQSSQTQSSHLSSLNFLVIAGIVVIVGTLRHWF